MQKEVKYSLLRILSCIAIVVLHMTYGAVSIYGNTTMAPNALLSEAIVNNLYWAVPCFVMVSGALLLDSKREITYKKIFSKYIFKVVIALLIFTLLYKVFDIIMNRETFTAKALLEGLVNFVTGKSWSHLWYLYMLIGLYLLLPFFRKITANSTNKELGGLLLIIFIFTSILPILQIWNIEVAFYIPIVTVYPLYFIAGYLIAKEDVKVPGWVYIVGFFVSTIILTTLTGLIGLIGVDFRNIFFDYSSFLVIIQALSIFGIFTRCIKYKDSVKQNFGTKLFYAFDECTFGIYLVHMFFARLVLRYLGINPYESIGLFIVCIIGIIVVSYLIVWALRKIPKVKKVL